MILAMKIHVCKDPQGSPNKYHTKNLRLYPGKILIKSLNILKDPCKDLCNNITKNYVRSLSSFKIFLKILPGFSPGITLRKKYLTRKLFIRTRTSSQGGIMKLLDTLKEAMTHQ